MGKSNLATTVTKHTLTLTVSMPLCPNTMKLIDALMILPLGDITKHLLNFS